MFLSKPLQIGGTSRCRPQGAVNYESGQPGPGARIHRQAFYSRAESAGTPYRSREVRRQVRRLAFRSAAVRVGGARWGIRDLPSSFAQCYRTFPLEDQSGMARFKYSSNIGTVNAVSPWAGL